MNIEISDIMKKKLPNEEGFQKETLGTHLINLNNALDDILETLKQILAK